MSAATVTFGVWLSDWVVTRSGAVAPRRLLVVVVLTSAAWAVVRRPALLLIALGTVSFARGVVEWRVDPAEPRTIATSAVLAEDPDPGERGTHVVFEIDGRRVDAWLFGRLARRVERASAGERVFVAGRIVTSRQPRSDLLHHVVGRVHVDDLRVNGGPSNNVQRSVNRLRELLARGVESLPRERRDLVSGLLYGDDRRVSSEVVAEFRASGLAHLTAVSGQNVAYVMAVAAPLLARCRPRTRLGASLVLLGFFVLVTRAEPSVIRAALMAGAALVLPRTTSRSARALAVAVVIGVIVDPFLVWSVGWWLSIGGCAGLVFFGPLVERALGGGRLARFAAPTLGAQLGVLPVSTLVFGLPRATGLLTNLIAGPVAGFVMLVGLPAVLVAAVAPPFVDHVVLLPVDIGTRFVALVADRGAALSTPRWLDVAMPLVVIGLVIAHASRSRVTRVATWTRGSFPRSRR